MEAVTRAVTSATARLDNGRPPTVLEIGSGGTAFLAMAAAKAGASPVISVELDTVLARKARATVSLNGMSDAIRVLEVHSEELNRSDIGSEGAHVIVAELFDDRLLGECILPTFRHALDNLACLNNTDTAESVITVPARASVQARLVSSPTLELMAAAHGAAGWPGVLLQSPLDPIEPLNLGALRDLVYHTEEWCALEFDFTDPSLSGRHTVTLTLNGDVSEAGIDAGNDGEVRVDGVAFWWNAVLFDSGHAEEANGADTSVEFSSVGEIGHWRECIFFLDTPLQARTGETVTVTAVHDDATVWFEVSIEGHDSLLGEDIVGMGRNKAPSPPHVDSDDEDDNNDDDDDARNDSSRTTTDSDEDAEEEEEQIVSVLGCERSRLWLLADKERNLAIMSAVEASMEDAPAGLVVSVCGGSGLCIEAALRTGVPTQNMLGVEWNSEVAAEVSRNRRLTQGVLEVEIIHGAHDLPAVIDAKLKGKDQVGGGANEVAALLSEGFFDEPLGVDVWGKGHALLWWWSVTSVKNANILASEAKIWPARGRVMARLVHFTRLWDATRRPACAAGFDLAPFSQGVPLGEWDATSRTYATWMHENSPVSEPWEICQGMDFLQDPPKLLASPPEGVPIVPCYSDHSPIQAANAIIYWIEYGDNKGTFLDSVSTGPSYQACVTQPTAWRQGVQFLSEPVFVPPGEAQLEGNTPVGMVAHASMDPLSGDLKCEISMSTESVIECSVQEPWFTLIESGLKTVEGRLYKGRFVDFKRGDTVKWFVEGTKRECFTEIVDIVRYSSFEDMLHKETVKHVLPGVPDVESGVNVYRKFYTKEKEAEYGVQAIHVRVMSAN